MLLGVHCSISGGVENAVLEAEGLQINTFQIFTKNQRMWKEKRYSQQEGQVFKDLMKEKQMEVAFSHTTYLLNLASPDPALREKSIKGLAVELERCDALGLPYAVLHPGSNKEVPPIESCKIIADSLNEVIRLTPGISAKVLLENTAGQGSVLGWDFAQLRDITDQVTDQNRLGVCFDTCHAFAAGYDIRTQEGIEATLADLDKHVGLENVLAYHLNDSKGDLGGHLDRHEHIGKGKIGLDAFRVIMNRFPDVPKVLETEKKDDWDRINVETLRGLLS